MGTETGNVAARTAIASSAIRKRYLDDDWLAQHTEEILDPALPIIDPHHHVWWDSPVPYHVEQLIADLSSGHNVRATVFMETGLMYRADGPEHLKAIGETEYVNGLAAMWASGKFGPTRACAGIVGHCDLSASDESVEVLRAHIAAGNGRFRGVRINPYLLFLQKGTVPPEGLLQDAAFRRGFARLAPLGLVVDAMCLHTQLLELADLARAFPETSIVLNHVGGPARIGPFANAFDEVVAQWSAGMQALARCPNVSVKLGGLANPFLCNITFRSRARPPSSEELAAALRPWIEPAMSWFGPERCMFESNFPADKFTCSYAVLWNAFKRLAEGCTGDEKAALLAGTAARVYGLQAL